MLKKRTGAPVVFRREPTFEREFDAALEVQERANEVLMADLIQARESYAVALQRAFEDDSDFTAEHADNLERRYQAFQQAYNQAMHDVRDRLRIAILAGYGFDIYEASLCFFINKDKAPRTFAVLSGTALPSAAGNRNILLNCVTASQETFAITLGVDVLHHAK